MRYYSDELKKFFDTEKECKEAELKAQISAEHKKANKAVMAKVIEEADAQLEVAYTELEKAKEQVKELQKEYDAKVDSIMNPAMTNVKECTKKRAEAIKAFNDKFGVYTTSYTGNQALNELHKMNNIFDNIFNKFIW
jgi:C1A family cysteine protease